MKFWRNFTTVALVAAFSASTAIAGMQPNSPAASRGQAKKCEKNTESSLVFPKVMAECYAYATSTGVGNQFPWESSTFFFSSFRNQYSYPAAVVNSLTSSTIESVHARAVSFSGGSTNTYGTGASSATISDRIAPLVLNMPLNTGGTVHGAIGDHTIGTMTGPGGAVLSDCTSCPGTGGPLGSRNQWFATIQTAGSPGVMMDHIGFVTGAAGGTIWDTHGNASCAGGERAYGSGSFANPNHLTSALGVDSFDFVWVFKGRGTPPPATIAQQLAEVIRLLLTPNGLRCSGLDMNPGDGKIGDDPIAWNDGPTIDPISPQIKAGGGGALITGDEEKDASRSAGF